jgi:rod shape-determining protein MreB
MIEAMEEPVNQVLEAIHMVLERTPPELVADVSQNGIVLSGGGSQLWGLDKLIAERTGISTILVDDALSCTAYGAGRMLQNLNDMTEGMINLARRKQVRL